MVDVMVVGALALRFGGWLLGRCMVNMLSHRFALAAGRTIMALLMKIYLLPGTKSFKYSKF